jgi:ubiquinol-cytochrome c reductase iron-sulfur subunit
MSAETMRVDEGRRRFLMAATSALGGAAIVGLASPFVLSMLPSERAKALGAPVEADISRIEPGMLVTYEWRGQPVWVLHRTEDMLATLAKIEPFLRDPNSNNSVQPDYAKNRYRSIKPSWLVLTGICTHLGCSPNFRPEKAPPDLGPNWLGGFFCACHGSRYDLAGRVFKDVPAPLNMAVPPYQFLSETTVLIGDDTKKQEA